MGNKCPPAGAPGWMVTFADLMALLLTLFVLLLTFAEMDIVKWKQLAGSMQEAFGVARKDKLSGMIELEGSIRRKAAADTDPTRRPDRTPTVSIMLDEPEAETPEQKMAKKREAEVVALQGAVKQAIADEIAGSGMTVEKSGNSVIIRFPSEIAFSSGSDILNPPFRATLEKLLPILEKTKGNIIVSGHTDNVPLSGGGKFRSNWDLSAGRATAVIHWFLNKPGMDPGRMTIQGFGDSRPIAPNDTSANRAKNRRVEVSIVQGGQIPGAPAQVAPGATPTRTPAPHRAPTPAPSRSGSAIPPSPMPVIKGNVIQVPMPPPAR